MSLHRLTCATLRLMTLLLTVSIPPVSGEISERVLERWFKTIWDQQSSECGVHLSCQDGSSSVSNSICCGFCDCEPDCMVHGTCCLGFYRNFSHGYNSIRNNRFGCIHAQYLDYGSSNYNTLMFYWLIAKCPASIQRDLNTQFCERTGNSVLIDDIIPVSDPVTNVHYKNKYCALCNGISSETKLIQWKLKVYNDHYISIPHERLLAVIQEQKGNVLFIPPSFLYVEKCSWPAYTVSTCNETGLWDEYNEVTEEACHSFIDPFNSTYQNYFCYLCNSPSSWKTVPLADTNCIEPYIPPIIDITPPFFAILDAAVVTGDQREENTLICDGNQFADYSKMMCRDILCHKRRFLSHGKCAGLQGISPKQCFKTFIKMTPLKEGHWTLDDIQNHLSSIEEAFIALMLINATIKEFQLFIMTDSLDRVVYMVTYLKISIEYEIRIGTAIESLMLLDNKKLTIELFWELNIELFVQFNLYNLSTDNESSILHVPIGTDGRVDHIVSTYVTKSNSVVCQDEETTHLNRLHTCPYVALDISEISFNIKADHLYIYKENKSDEHILNLSKWEYYLDYQNVYVCLQSFIKLYKDALVSNSQKDVDKEIPVETKQLLSLCCVCFSVACLLVTLTTNLYFPVLRSQPGINNTILCTFLLLAQITYQFGAGQRFLSNWSCALVGAFCHFLWLSVIFSMNVCSIHMFKTFKNSTILCQKFQLTSTFWYVMYICAASLACVIVNLVVSFATENDSGYVGSICYISSSLMQIITFIVPALITLTVNIILFTYVVFKIKHIRVKSATIHSERNYFAIYARLSTLTGITWLFGFLNLLLRLDIFEYLFIVFNASQGVFIMIAFVLNQKVYNLICHRDNKPISTDSKQFSQ